MRARLSRALPPRGPVRTLALATLVNTAGNGIFFTVSALYFTRIVGLSILEVGVGLSIAGVFGLVAGVPMGHLADRRGARDLMLLLLLLIAGASALLLLVQTFWQFVLVTSLVAFLDRGAGAVRGAMIAGAVAGAERARTRAYLRAVTNVGMTAGTAVAAVALHYDTRQAYATVLLLDVATYLVTMLVLRRMPRIPPVPAEHAARATLALRDRPYVLVTMVSAVLGMHYTLLEVGLPLWVANFTTAPTWTVAVLFTVNTVGVVLFQVAVSTRVATVRAALRATTSAGVVLLAGCGLFALAAGRPPGQAVTLLVLASLVHLVGELLQAAAGFLLSFELAAEHAQGQYQGLFSTGFGISSMAAPTVIAVLPLTLGAPGWWVFGGILLAAALLTVPAVRWAQATRDRYAVPPPWVPPAPLAA